MTHCTDCKIALTQDELRYYENRCERCERRLWHKLTDAGLPTAEDVRGILTAEDEAAIQSPHCPPPPKDDDYSWWEAYNKISALYRELLRWRPIDTAPHEKRIILGWWDEDVWSTEIGFASHGWSRGGISNMSRHGQATHWMPQPPAPLR